jgi:fibro-slime domain-containing protein
VRHLTFLSLGLALLLSLGCSGADGGSENLDGNGNGDGGLGLDGGLDGTSDPDAELHIDGAPLGDGSATDTGNKCGSTLTGVLRDFKDDHPDFEKFLGDDRGIVKTDLGSDQKPVYASSSNTPTTTGKANFDQWYRDVKDVNLASTFAITLTKGASGVYTYTNPAFFPLDGKGFGDQGREHNFHFTYELHTTFAYGGGETFEFTGDDDLWVFVNNKLAIDLGGVHGAENGSIDLDMRAAELGIVKGKVYALDFFFAERHTSESTFRIDTTLDFVDCGSGIK